MIDIYQKALAHIIQHAEFRDIYTKQQGLLMNRLCYRVIFNKHLGRLVVVSEMAKAQTKSNVLGGSLNKPTGLLGCLKTKLAPLTIACWLGFSSSAFASIISDSQAPDFQRPVIAAAKNDRQQTVALVQIQTPSQGISHNKYAQFDVPSQGVILNNARTGASTQLAGTVAANPFLKQGEAHTIVNEVRSNKPSQLAGSIEVAGQKANLIIANPSGINVAGAGFINVHEATLSTGRITNDQGAIGHEVTQGQITIHSSNGSNIGLGGENKNADLVNLYARAMELNAQVYADSGIVSVGGANKIDAQGRIKPIEAADNNYYYTVDVKELGGMHANSIYIVGSKQGFGVNQRGTISGKLDVMIHSDGRIEHLGSIISSKGSVTMESKERLVNLGGVTASKRIDLKSGDIDQIGNLTADQDIHVLSNAISANNTNIHSKHGNITLSAKEYLMLDGAVLVANDGAANIHVNDDALIIDANVVANQSVTLASLQGSLMMADSKISSTRANVSLFAKNYQQIYGTVAHAGENTLVQSGNLEINNSQVNSAKHTTIYTQGNQTTTNSTIAAKGIVSDVVKANHTITDTSTYQAGAVLLDSTQLVLDGKLVAKTSKTPLLSALDGQSANNQTQVINGALSIQTDGVLTLNSTNHHFSSEGDVSLVSKADKLSLINTNPILDGHQDSYILNAHEGNLTLQGSEVQLQGVDLTSKNKLTIYATQGSVLIDGVKRDFSNKNQSGSQQAKELQADANRADVALKAFEESKEYRDYLKERQDVLKKFKDDTRFLKSLKDYYRYDWLDKARLKKLKRN